MCARTCGQFKLVNGEKLGPVSIDRERGGEVDGVDGGERTQRGGLTGILDGKTSGQWRGCC